MPVVALRRLVHSASRSPSLFLIDGGVAINLASAMMPSRIINPFSDKCPLMVSTIWCASAFVATRSRNASKVVASGADSRPRSIPTKARMAGCRRPPPQCHRPTDQSTAGQRTCAACAPARPAGTVDFRIERIDQLVQLALAPSCCRFRPGSGRAASVLSWRRLRGRGSSFAWPMAGGGGTNIVSGRTAAENGAKRIN